MTRPCLLVAFLLLLGSPLSLSAGPSPGRTFAVSPFAPQDGEDGNALGGSISPALSLLIAYQSGWSDADLSGAAALLTGSYREHAGSLRLRAELLRPGPSGKETLTFNLSGRAGEVGLLLVELSTLVGEALEGTFVPMIRPPAPAAPDYLVALDEPSFPSRDPDEDVAQTEAFLLSAVSIDSANADACHKLGVLYAQSGRLEEALAYLKTASDLRPDHAPYHFALGVVLNLEGRREEALTEFLQATFLNPSSAKSFLALGQIRRGLGDYQAARAAIARAEELLPGEHATALAAGTTAVLEENAEEARRLLERVLAADPRSTTAYVNLGLLELAEGRRDLAGRAFSKALASRPDSPEALNNMALLESGKGLSREVLAKLEDAKEAGSLHEERILFNISALQLQWGLWEEANSTLEALLTRTPSSPFANNNLGVTALLRGQVEESLDRFETGLEGDPGSPLLHYNAALAYQLTGREQQALVHYLRAVRSRRDFVDAHINLAMLFESMGREEKALTEYLKVLSSTHTRPEVYVHLGRNYAARGYDSMAVETIRKATLVEASLAAPYYYLALAHEKREPSRAREYWERFVDTVRMDPNRAFWIARAEERLAKLGGAGQRP